MKKKCTLNNGEINPVLQNVLWNLEPFQKFKNLKLFF